MKNRPVNKILQRGHSMKIKPLSLIILAAGLIYTCVGPPDAEHGFVENFPVVVNIDSVFVYTLRGEDYSFEETYNIQMDLSEGREITSILVVTEYIGSISDTSQIWLLNDQDFVQQSWTFSSNLIQVETQAVDSIYYFPTKVMMSGNHFSGVLEFTLTSTTSSD